MTASRLPAGTPRLVATDLDGTLLGPDGRVSPRTRAALRRLWDLGIETVFVTARPPRWLDELVDVAGAHGLVICANGAFLYDVAARRVIRTQGLSPAQVCDLTLALRRALPGIGFAAELADGMVAERAFPFEPWPPPDATLGRLDRLDRPVGKLLARMAVGGEPQGDAFLARVVDVVAQRAIVAFSGAGGLAEIGPPGVSKASALAAWCAERGIGPGEVWAFGDMPNDIPMLTWAGRSFAVANAHPNVAAVATSRCASNADDGVARVLEEIG